MKAKRKPTAVEHLNKAVEKYREKVSRLRDDLTEAIKVLDLLNEIRAELDEKN